MDMSTLICFSLVVSFIVLGPLTLLIAPYIALCTNYYAILILYYSWVLYDFRTSHYRERRWARQLSIWKYFCNYFPMKLIATHKLDPKKNYIIGLHPHGTLAFGVFNICTDATGFSDKFPGIKAYALCHLYALVVPLRELLTSLGISNASASSFNDILNNNFEGKSSAAGGKALALFPGGAQEMLATNRGNQINLVLQKRKGFVRLALQNGASLVPAFTFGESRLYNHWEGEADSTLRKLQEWVKRYTGLPILLVTGRFQFFPFRKQLTTVVGSPIEFNKVENPTQDEVDSLHGKYVASLISLFNAYKGSYGCEDDVLNFIG